MFMDTPKLQPISKSTPKPSDKNVPSNSSSNSSGNNNNKSASKISGSSGSNNKDGTAGESKDSCPNDKDNRCNYGSYRNQNYPRNYKNREFDDYHSNNHFNSSNSFPSYCRPVWDNWDRTKATTYNTNYNRNWNPNYNRNTNNYRNNYNDNSRYNKSQETFTEDTFQCNNFNEESNKATETTEQINTTNVKKNKSPNNNNKNNNIKNNINKNNINKTTPNKSKKPIESNRGKPNSNTKKKYTPKGNNKFSPQRFKHKNGFNNRYNTNTRKSLDFKQIKLLNKGENKITPNTNAENTATLSKTNEICESKSTNSDENCKTLESNIEEELLPLDDLLTSKSTNEVNQQNTKTLESNVLEKQSECNKTAEDKLSTSVTAEVQSDKSAKSTITASISTEIQGDNKSAESKLSTTVVNTTKIQAANNKPAKPKFSTSICTKVQGVNKKIAKAKPPSTNLSTKIQGENNKTTKPKPLTTVVNTTKIQTTNNKSAKPKLSTSVCTKVQGETNKTAKRKLSTNDSTKVLSDINKTAKRIQSANFSAEALDDNNKSAKSKHFTKVNRETTNNLSATASNANVIEKQTEEFLNSYTAEELNSTASISKHSYNTDLPKINLQTTTKPLEQPVTVLTTNTNTLPLEVPRPRNSNSLSENENFEFHIPKISLIPLSRLIATDFWETTANESSPPLVLQESPRPQNTQTHKQLFKPNLIKRKRNVSTCSNSSTGSQTSSATDRLVEKLVTMNKINLKNIINSSGTKYDEALKTQARKRLREEIRRQLKGMNIEPPKDPINNDFEPDEIVDAIDIPDVVFDEIRKALGLELFNYSEDVNMKTIDEILTTSNNMEINSNTKDDSTINNNQIAQPSAEIAENLFSLIPQELLLMPMANELPIEHMDIPPTATTQANDFNCVDQPQPDKVKCEIKPVIKVDNLSQTSDKSKYLESRSKSKKLTKRKESRKSKRHRSPKRTKEDIVILVSSSSSESSSSSSSSTSSSSSSSSSSSDSESDTSARSASSAAKRRRQKLKVDAENVVDSFEKLILCSLSDSLRERYRSKYSVSTNTKLHFISCICASEYNSGKFSKLQIAKIQKNLKSSDCSMALEFLMKEIVNVFNKQKQVAKMEDSRKSSKYRLESSKESSKENCKGSSTNKKNTQATNENSNRRESSHGNILKPISSSTTSTCTSSSMAEGIKTKSVHVAQKVTTDSNGENHIQECVTKVLSLYRQEMKAAMQSKELSNNQPSTATKSAAATAEHQTRKEQSTSMNSSSSPSATATVSSLSTTAIQNKTAGTAKEHDETHLQNPINPINHQQQQTSQPQQPQTETVSNNHNENPDKSNEPSQQTRTPSSSAIGRECNTPETKKCSGMETTQIMQMPTFCSTEYNTAAALSNFGSSLMGITSNSYNQQPSFPMVDLEALRRQSPIGEVVVNNLREIDVKLMELHKRKMYIEEMILKLQKDKMEADLLTIKLQNEKFILLNTAMTANVTSTTVNSNTQSNSEKKESYFNNINNIKTETIILSDTTTTNEVDKPPAVGRKKSIKTRPVVRKILAKVPVIRKRKLAATKLNTTKENAKKACKEIKQNSKKYTKTTTETKTASKTANMAPKTTKNSTIKSTTTEKTGKKITENTAKKIKEYVAKKSTETETKPSLPPFPHPPPPSLPDPPPPLQEQMEISEINNNPPNVEVPKIMESINSTKSIYKDMPTGFLYGIRNPITQIRVFEQFIIASSEDGKLYKFDVATFKLLIQFSKHSEAITQMHLCGDKKVIYTTSLDGYLKKSSLENFALDIQSIYVQEPLQSIDIQWDVAYIGSRWGNIYTYDLVTKALAEKALCSTDSSIISIRATKEGPRKILIVSSKGNLIHLRDANSGLLLRTFDVPESINIYSILLNEGIIYCGTQKKEIRKYDFVNGTHLGVMTCGNGAVSMQIYNNKYIFVGCYDGFIYILDKTTGKQVGRLAGAGKMILTLEIVEDKIITSAKDNTMKVTDIPSYCLENNTKTN